MSDVSAGDCAQTPSSPDHGQASRATRTVALLTGSQDKPYALGLAMALASEGIGMDFIGSDYVDGPELHGRSEINYLNLRGCQRTDASVPAKILRVAKYYARLLAYAVTAKPPIFHVLWNDRPELFDRVVLTLYYRLLGRRVVFTAHNVNEWKWDSRDSFLYRLSLRIQYSLVDRIFVHTERMKEELMADFLVPAAKVAVIPFGINNTLPTSTLTVQQARGVLNVDLDKKIMLCFGYVRPYKGLEYLIEALGELHKRDKSYRLLIAGPNLKQDERYLERIRETIDVTGIRGSVVEHIGFVPDEKVQAYFKAADVIVMPYVHIFQSGVLFLAYSFGMPAIVTDVGSLKEHVIEGRTGFVCRPRDPLALAACIDRYFKSDLYQNLEDRRHEIRQFANDRYSWTQVAEVTKQVYSELTRRAAR
jgi:glycosyltransferase involved in cell wall biosynthesis